MFYRFGALGHPEFTYPAEAAGSFQKFTGTHYFRAQVDRRDVSFTNSKVSYDIFSDYDSESSGPNGKAGVMVTKSGNTKGSKTLLCTAPYLDNLHLLDGVLKVRDYLEEDE